MHPGMYDQGILVMCALGARVCCGGRLAIMNKQCICTSRFHTSPANVANVSMRPLFHTSSLRHPHSTPQHGCDVRTELLFTVPTTRDLGHGSGSMFMRTSPSKVPFAEGFTATHTLPNGECFCSMCGHRKFKSHPDAPFVAHATAKNNCVWHLTICFCPKSTMV